MARKKNASPAQNNQGILDDLLAELAVCDSTFSVPRLNIFDPDDSDEIDEAIAICKRKLDEAVGELANKVEDVDGVELAIRVVQDYAKSLKAPKEPKRKKMKKHPIKAALVAEHGALVKRGPGRKRDNDKADEELAKKYGLKNANVVRKKVSLAKAEIALQNPFKEYLDRLQKEEPQS